MPASDRPPPPPTPDTATPARNFTLTVAERVSAMMAGAPAYARRLRAIEDLHERLVRRVAAGPPDTPEAEQALAAELARINDLIDRHNRYYPIERDLPSDPRTGDVIDRGRAWRPLPPVTMESLRACM